MSCVDTTEKLYWQHLAYKIEVDPSRQFHSKLYKSEEDEHKLTAHKRKPDGKLGSDHAVPSSVERSRKEPRRQDSADTDETIMIAAANQKRMTT